MSIYDTNVVFNSDDEPLESHLPVTSIVNYSGSADFILSEGDSSGVVFFNTSDSLINYKNNSVFTKLNDHNYLEQSGSIKHTDLDTHYNNTAIHFEILNEENLVSNSNTKCATQSSIKTYLDNNLPEKKEFTYAENINAGDLLKIVNGLGVKVEKLNIADYSLVNTLNVASIGGYLFKAIYIEKLNRVVVAYGTSASKTLYSAVCDIQGNSLVINTATTLDCTSEFLNNGITSIELSYDCDYDKVVYIVSSKQVSYSANSLIVCSTISGNSITFENRYNFSSVGRTGIVLPVICYVKGVGTVLTTRSSAANDVLGYPRIDLLDVSTTSISIKAYYTSINLPSSSTKTHLVHLEGSKFIHICGGYVYPITISGTSITEGSGISFTALTTSSSGQLPSFRFPGSNKTIIVFQEGTVTYYSTLDYTNGVITIPLKDTAFTSNPYYIYPVIDSYRSRVFLNYISRSPYYSYSRLLTLSGNTLVFGTATQNTSTSSLANYTNGVVGKFNLISYKPNNTTTTQKDFYLYDLDDRNYFVGIAQQTGTTGNTYPVSLLFDTSTAHTGATPGIRGYIQSDGTLGTSVTSYPIGMYLSSTNFLITKD